MLTCKQPQGEVSKASSLGHHFQPRLLVWQGSALSNTLWGVPTFHPGTPEVPLCSGQLPPGAPGCFCILCIHDCSLTLGAHRASATPGSSDCTSGLEVEDLGGGCCCPTTGPGCHGPQHLCHPSPSCHPRHLAKVSLGVHPGGTCLGGGPGSWTSLTGTLGTWDLEGVVARQHPPAGRGT